MPRDSSTSARRRGALGNEWGNCCNQMEPSIHLSSESEGKLLDPLDTEGIDSSNRTVRGSACPDTGLVHNWMAVAVLPE
jgi:hypothetical protein